MLLDCGKADAQLCEHSGFVWVEVYSIQVVR